ncbi:leucine-rich repeat protein [Aquimarina gracilis]|uniref:Leucine-rich repeat protein n=1 Tax=Aquimarina gracilis TaxID=874422 RepID=A0ABU5ZZ60_9FLAO|nr:leucine-rich repeat protein [Aquimarina gracilis]MEB3347183.1 leucine-rich repeat protein [Aquimarina gracilis]
MKKQLQLIVYIVFTLLVALPGYGQQPQIDDYFYTDNGIGYAITSTSPKEVKIFGHPKGFPAGSFVRKLDIPPTVTCPNNAFRPTNNGTISIDCPQGEYKVTGINSEAFGYEYWLSEVTIPNTVRFIEQQAFAGNEHDPDLHDKLRIALVIPNSVERIDLRAFGYSGLTGVTIGQGITRIEPNVFQGNNLESVVIPDRVTTIGPWAFALNKLTSVTIGQGVTRIEVDAFAFNKLTHVAIPDNVTTIEARAFRNNPIATVVSERTDPPSIQANTFANSNQIDVIVPKGAYDNYVPAWDHFGFKSIREKVDIGDTFTNEGIKYQVTALGVPNEVMIVDYESALTRVFIPETVRNGGHDFEVTKIENFAFADKQLNNVTIGQNVTSIGESAFQRNNLTSVNIPNSVTSIGFSAFSRNALTSVDIPGSVTSIGVGAFNSNALTRVNIQDGVKNIERDAFSDNPDLATVLSTGYDPPLIKADPEDPFTNANRNQINLIVPVGRIDAYEAAGWTGFRTTSEGIGVSIEDVPVEEITDISAFTVTFTFGSSVTGFTIDDIKLTNASASNFTGSGATYTADIKPELCNGIIEIKVPENVVEPVSNISNLPASTMVKVNAIQKPEISSLLVEYCIGDSAVALTATGTNLLWYDSETGGTGSATAPVPDTGTVGDTFYYVSQTNDSNDCESARVEIVVRVNPQLVAPIISSNPPICSGEDAIFTITGTPGDIVTYSGALSGTAIIEADETVNVIVNGADSDTTLELTQVSNGGCSMPLTETATVIVQGDRVIAVTQDITVQLDASGQATITPAQVNRSSRGGCNNFDPIFLNLDKTTFNCDDVGTPATVTLTATQGSETATATALVTVEDHLENLVAMAQDMTVQLDNNGEATISPEDINNGSVYGCGNINIPQLSLDIDTFTCNDVGTPVMVTLTATQGSETATATATVTVKEYLDNLVAIAKDITVPLDTSGQATISPEDVDDGSNYGCNNTPELGLDRDTFTCDDVGTPITVTLIATYGTNTATATATVTVEAAGNCESEPKPVADFNRGFSPNGDGIADTLVIEGLEQYKNNVVKIYNLSQRLVFMAHYGGPNDGWDGTHKGNRVPVGSYVCVIDYNEPGLDHETKMIYVNY